MFLGNVLLQGVFLDGFKITMVAINEEHHVLGLRVGFQSTLPLGLVGTHVTAVENLNTQYK